LPEFRQKDKKSLVIRLRAVFKSAVLAKNGKLSLADWRLHDELLQQYIRLRNNNLRAFQIPARSRMTKDFLSFCLNSGNAGPSENEVYRWAKGRTEIPYLNELLAGFSKNKNWAQHDIQSTIWNLQNEASWEQYPSHIKSILQSIDANAAIKLPSDLKARATGEITNILLDNVPGLNEIKNATDHIRGRYYDYKDYADSIRRRGVDSTGLPSDDEAFEFPDSDVFASTQSHGYSSQTITFYNPTDRPFTVDLTQYHLVPVREKVQRIGLGRVDDGAGSDQLLEALEDGLFGTMLRMGIGFTPGLSDVADIYELLLGQDFISGRALSATDRVFAGLELLSGTGMGIRFAERALYAPERYAANFEHGFSHVAQKEMRLANVEREEVARFMSEAKTEAVERAGAPGRIRRFNPTTAEGPLSKIPAGKGSVADTFRSSSYVQYENAAAEKLYRVQSRPFAEGSNAGSYWTRVKPEGPSQAALDSALHPEFRNNGTHWLEADVPPGQTFFEGAAGPQKGMLGGGNQIYIQDFNPKWLVKQGKF